MYLDLKQKIILKIICSRRLRAWVVKLHGFPSLMKTYTRWVCDQPHAMCQFQREGFRVTNEITVNLDEAARSIMMICRPQIIRLYARVKFVKMWKRWSDGNSTLSVWKRISTNVCIKILAKLKWGDLFLRRLVPLFWTSGNVYPGFQSQGGSLACALRCLGTIDYSDSSLASPAGLLTASILVEPFWSSYKKDLCPKKIINAVDMNGKYWQTFCWNSGRLPMHQVTKTEVTVKHLSCL